MPQVGGIIVLAAYGDGGGLSLHAQSRRPPLHTSAPKTGTRSEKSATNTPVRSARRWGTLIGRHHVRRFFSSTRAFSRYGPMTRGYHHPRGNGRLERSAAATPGRRPSCTPRSWCSCCPARPCPPGSASCTRSPSTPTRAGELEALTWGDVDLDHGVIHVHQAMNRKSGEVESTKSGRRGAPPSSSPCGPSPLKIMTRAGTPASRPPGVHPEAENLAAGFGEVFPPVPPGVSPGFGYSGPGSFKNLGKTVEPTGIEPVTSCMPCMRSPS